MSTVLRIATKKAASERDFTKLQFMRIKIAENVRLIPKDIIEAVKGRLFSPEQFYEYQETQIKYENPSNFLYAIVDEDKKIVGFLWAQHSQLDSTLFINTFSMSKEYWHKGKAFPLVIKFLESLKDKLKCPVVLWVTTNDKFYVKHGFKRSKNVLMEYNSN